MKEWMNEGRIERLKDWKTEWMNGWMNEWKIRVNIAKNEWMKDWRIERLNERLQCLSCLHWFLCLGWSYKHTSVGISEYR